jgi:hypothetical protein
MELKKRWQPVRYLSNRFHWFLADTEPDHEASFNWACIEAKSIDGPFKLEIWNMDNTEWDTVTTLKTLKEAKAVGRLLAGVALNKNI